MEYRKEIDGLRAVAVLPVIFFHAGIESFSGGFVGVDVFFVISGYLITSIILFEKEQGKFSFIKFYDRRARRLLPALFFVMLATIPFSWIIFMPGDLKNYSDSLTAVSIFGSNIYFWRESGYFDVAAEMKPLLHTWSLAVEEQFYILFPLYLILILHLRKRWVLISIIILGVFSLLLAQWGAYNKPVATFFLLPTRAWELMIGATAAFILFYGNSQNELIKRNKYVSEWLGAIGLLLIGFSVLTFNKTVPYPSFYTAIPALGTFLIILFSSDKTYIGKLLSIKFLVGIGLISYSAYLWHYPVFVYLRHLNLTHINIGLLLVILILVFMLSYCSWKYIEQPFRNRNLISRRMVFGFSIIGSILFISIGVIGSVNSGFEDYYFANRLDPVQINNYQLIRKHTDYNPYEVMEDNDDCVFWSRTIDEDVSNRFNSCHKKYGRAIVVLGDSHAMNLYNIVAISKQHPFVMGVSQGGCRPQENKVKCHYDVFDDFLELNKDKLLYIIFHQSGSYFVEDAKGQVDSSLAFEDGQKYYFRKDFINIAIDYIANIKNQYGIKIYWVGPYAEARIDFKSKKLLNGKFVLNHNSLKIFSELEDILNNEIKMSNKITENDYISFSKIINIKPGFLRVDNCITYRDIDHFSKCGENIIASHIKSVLQLLH